MAKERLVMWKTDGMVLKLGEVTGKDTEGKAVVAWNDSFNVADLKKFPELVDQLLVHAVKQKLGDAGAGEDTAQGKITAASSVWKHLVMGHFNAPTREGGKKEQGVAVDKVVEQVFTLPEEMRETFAKSLGIWDKYLVAVQTRNTAQGE